MPTSRRTLLQVAGFLFPSFLINPLGLFRSLFAPDGEVGILKRPRPNAFLRDGKVLVGVVGGEEPEGMVRRAVSLIGGVERLGVKGKRVLVKPNVVSSSPPPTTTRPEVVGAVVRLLKEAGAAEVVVGDMSALVNLPTRPNLEKTGIARAAREAGAEVIDFDEAAWVEVKPPEVRLLRSIHVAKPVYEADLLVNVPVVKTHRNAVFSACLKNLVGVTHPRYRPYRVSPNHWQEVVAELNLAAHPDLNVVDATTVMAAGGPWEGTAKEAGMVMASGDRIAADAAALGLIKSFGEWEAVKDTGVWEFPQVRRARELGLGVQEKASVRLLSEWLAEGGEDFSERVRQMREFLEA